MKHIFTRVSKASVPRSGAQGKQSKCSGRGWLLSDRVQIAGTITMEKEPAGLHNSETSCSLIVESEVQPYTVSAGMDQAEHVGVEKFEYQSGPAGMDQ
ncbi:hypothetical protein Tco_0564206 [Tanacetum coccineum]